MPWLLNEDAALLYKLRGMTVQDANAPAGGRPVAVRFRLPETELSVLTYPICVIEFLGAFYAPERAMRSAPITLPYAPEGYAPWTNDSTGVDYDPSVAPYQVSEYPIPYNLDYQITVYSRLARSHHFPLIARMQMPDMIPPVGGYLDVPQDNTTRTMLLTGGPSTGYATDDDGKRLLTSTARVRVFSELLPSAVTLLTPGNYPRVSEIDIDLSVYNGPGPMTLAQLQESVGIMSSSLAVGWNTLAKD